MGPYFENPKPLWTPPRPPFTAAERLRQLINRKHGLHLENYHDLHKYSVESYTFWLDLWEFLDIISSVPPKKVIENGIMPEVPVWFPEARLNYAENHLYRTDDAIACTAGGETGVVRDYSYRQLRELVRQMACAMRRHGLQTGDRVAAIVNNTITAVVICFAAASIGAIFMSTGSDMGTPTILGRFCQVKPKFVFAETEVLYGGNVIDLAPKISEILQALSKHGLQQAITLPSLVTGKEITILNSSPLSKFLSLDDGHELVFEQLPFGHPLFILYTSGTSGTPKGLIHSAGGALMQTKKEIRIHFGANPGDAFFQWTTTGWMLWNGMLSNFSNGSRLVLYDGSPFHPDIRTFLKFVNDQGVSVFGTSPRFLAEIHGQGIKPLEIGPFEALQTLSSTGAVLTSPMFTWAQKAFGEHVHLTSTCGATDICATFVTGNNTMPVYAGETQCKTLGMDIQVYDSQGNNIEHTGVPGEMVVVRPHPSLPLYLWGDESGKKYRETYYSMYPGVWRQGDFIVINPATKGIKILGRSDGVLNPSGVRFGAAEIYSVLEQFSSEINDSLCVGQQRPQDTSERVLLFLKMRPGHPLDDRLVAKIKSAIRTALSARHVPAFVLPVEDIPVCGSKYCRLSL
ncbi:acetoacetyl-CoA synthetase [Mycena rosella]|uniref:Acetoacetyl-CoA synthetase n=1 Tax=Mycena rosella TaxID=1033263 RepID=A0AAD7GP86_MYCRO|nr:acetoacetyl-CoA synthetase [Mycena rosella]